MDISQLTISAKPAGFWIRGGALLIDFILFLPFGFIAMYNTRHWQSMPLLIIIPYILPGITYKPLMEWKFGATIGKMICKIHVIDRQGGKLSLTAAYLRFLPFLLVSIFSAFSLILLWSSPEYYHQAASSILKIRRIIVSFWWIDCLVAPFRNRKEALHDVIAQSYCVYKS